MATAVGEAELDELGAPAADARRRLVGRTRSTAGRPSSACDGWAIVSSTSSAERPRLWISRCNSRDGVGGERDLTGVAQGISWTVRFW